MTARPRERRVTSSVAKAVEKAGVVGAGGGGFPTHVKASAKADTVLANGAECEPLLRSDTELMTANPERIVRGLTLIRESVGADRAILAVKKKNEQAIRALAGAVERDDRIETVLLENVYPAGDEYLLVFEATGRVIPEGGIPLDVGVVVNNVTTLACVADAVEGRPVTRRMVTVQGEVAAPATFLVPLGTAIGDIIALAGGATTSDFAVIVGGPMMGYLSTDLDEPLTKTTAGLIVLPSDHTLVARRAASQAHVLKIARAACCQCLACTELCPRALLGHELAPHRTVRAIQYSMEAQDAAHITSAFLCCECGMCELFACPLEIQPRRILADLKAELTRRGVENPHRRTDLSPDDVRQYRQLPASRLVQRLGLSPYDGPAPLSPVKVSPDRVVLRMKQHAGSASKPVVGAGQSVLEGDLVGEIEEGSLGARVHASIRGTVASVSPESVVVTAS